MSSTISNRDKTEAILNRQGIFGLGFSNNNNLDLLNLVVLASAGIIIKLFFQENYTEVGNTGPASTTIWGYGLTAISLFLMIFMSLYLYNANNKTQQDNNDSYLENKEKNFMMYIQDLLLNDTLPLVLTLGLIIYIISLNFIYFIKINSNNVSDSYHTYSFYSSFLLIIQIGIIVKYMFNLLHKNNGDNKQAKNIALIKSLSYVLITINVIFIMIIHILLAWFSTDG